MSSFSSGSHNWTTKDSSAYSNFAGTSAAPHVAGVAELILSYLNIELPNYNNLAPEDVEFILQWTAVDRNTGTHPGYDTLTGFGIIDARAAMTTIHKDKYSLEHFGTDAFPHSQNHSLFSTNDTVILSERYENVAGNWFLQNTPYVVNTFKINAISGHIINSNESVIASWARPSSSNTFALFDTENVVMPRERITLDSITFLQGFMTGYIYQVSDTLGNSLGWWPSDTLTDFDLTYTLLKEDTTVFLNEEDLVSDNSIIVYPNPSDGQQSLVLNLDQPFDATIRLIDINGRLINPENS